jgi:transcription initiation factor IIE alpha subunit
MRKKLKKINTTDREITTIQANVEEVLTALQLQIDEILKTLKDLEQRVYDLENP